MVRPDQDRIGSRPGEHVEVDETWLRPTRGKGRGVHDKVLVASAVEVRQRKPAPSSTSGRVVAMPAVRLAIVPDRSAGLLCGFVECAVVPARRSSPTTGACAPCRRGDNTPPPSRRPHVAEEQAIFISASKPETVAEWSPWSRTTPGATFNEFTFRFNRRFYPFNAFRSRSASRRRHRTDLRRALLRAWQHPTCWCGNNHTTSIYSVSSAAINRRGTRSAFC